MRKNPTYDIEQDRVTIGPLKSTKACGANGVVLVSCGENGETLTIICSDGSGWKQEGLPGPVWQHVSVKCRDRTPTWAEMDYVKRIFWRDDELVMQFHVPRADHINIHDHVLHLWFPIGVTIPTPPKECV